MNRLLPWSERSSINVKQHEFLWLRCLERAESALHIGDVESRVVGHEFAVRGFADATPSVIFLR